MNRSPPPRNLIVKFAFLKKTVETVCSVPSPSILAKSKGGAPVTIN